MDTAEFVAAVDWGAVATGMRETKAEAELAIAQHVAEVRAAGRRETLTDKELLAKLQDGADLLEAFIHVIEG